jgi:hypothetical protein
MTEGDLAAIHALMQKLSGMQPEETAFSEDEYYSDHGRPDRHDFSVGEDALKEWSYIRNLHNENPWSKATASRADTYMPDMHVAFEPYVNHAYLERNTAQDEALKTSGNSTKMMTGSRPDYDRSRRPAGQTSRCIIGLPETNMLMQTKMPNLHVHDG